MTTPTPSRTLSTYAVIVLGAFCTPMMGSSINIALPAIAKAFSLKAVMSAVDRSSYGIASATIGTMRLLGQMFSMGLAMLIMVLYLGDAAITAANRADFIVCVRVTAVLFAAFCFAGIFASFARGKMR